MKERSIIFWDFDGVIADSFSFLADFLTDYTKNNQRPLRDEEVRKGFESAHFWDGLESFGIDKSIREEYTTYEIRNYPENVQLFESMTPVLKTLNRSYDFYLISGNLSHVIKRTLKKYDIDDLFIDIQGRDMEGYKSEKIKKILQDKNLKSQSFYVGDTVGDMKEAKKAGLVSVGATWGFHSRDRLKKVSPDYLCDSPEELLKFFI